MTRRAAVINFCTTDFRFLDKCLSALPQVDQILIPISDHFFDGTPENYALLQKIYAAYPHVQFIEFAFTLERVYGTPSAIRPFSPGWAQHWHNTARLIATYYLDQSIDTVLFLDVDEIFREEIPKILTDPYNAIRFAEYWYFLSPAYRAYTTPHGPLLIKREHLTPERLLDPHERMGLFVETPPPKEIAFFVEGRPIVDHYSWVRTPEELSKKVASWGHHWERDWHALLQGDWIEKIEKGGADYIRGYRYEKVAPTWDPLAIEVPAIAPITLEKHREKTFSNLVRINAAHLDRLELLRLMDA